MSSLALEDGIALVPQTLSGWASVEIPRAQANRRWSEQSSAEWGKETPPSSANILGYSAQLAAASISPQPSLPPDGQESALNSQLTPNSILSHDVHIPSTDALASPAVGAQVVFSQTDPQANSQPNLQATTQQNAQARLQPNSQAFQFGTQTGLQNFQSAAPAFNKAWHTSVPSGASAVLQGTSSASRAVSAQAMSQSPHALPQTAMGRGKMLNPYEYATVGIEPGLDYSAQQRDFLLRHIEKRWGPSHVVVPQQSIVAASALQAMLYATGASVTPNAATLAHNAGSDTVDHNTAAALPANSAGPAVPGASLAMRGTTSVTPVKSAITGKDIARAVKTGSSQVMAALAVAPQGGMTESAQRVAAKTAAAEKKAALAGNILSQIKFEIRCVPARLSHQYFDLYFTVGLGAYPMAVPVDNKEYLRPVELERVEFMMRLPPGYPEEQFRNMDVRTVPEEEQRYGVDPRGGGWMLLLFRALALQVLKSHTYHGQDLLNFELPVPYVTYQQSYTVSPNLTPWPELAGCVLVEPQEFDATANLCKMPQSTHELIRLVGVLPLYREELTFKEDIDAQGKSGGRALMREFSQRRFEPWLSSLTRPHYLQS